MTTIDCCTAPVLQLYTMHRLLPVSNPWAYAWGRYYAINPPAGAAPPAVSLSPTQLTYNPCKVARANCVCQSSWSYGGKTYQYCADSGIFSGGAWGCPVVDETACFGQPSPGTYAGCSSLAPKICT